MHPWKVLGGTISIALLCMIPVSGLIYLMHAYTSWNSDVQQIISGGLGIAAGCSGISYSINRWG